MLSREPSAITPFLHIRQHSPPLPPFPSTLPRGVLPAPLPSLPPLPREADAVQEGFDLGNAAPGRNRLRPDRSIGDEDVQEVQTEVGEEGGAGKTGPGHFFLQEAWREGVREGGREGGREGRKERDAWK